MFKNTFQSGFLSILYSLGYISFALFDNLNILVSSLVADILGCSLIDLFYDVNRSKPLQIWDKEGL